jgi:Flp pilus assembly protein TadD
VVTDAGEKRGREVALRFEQMRTVFASLMPKARITLPVPLQIVAFRSTKEMRQFVPLWKGKPTDVSGLFQSGMDRSYIMVDLSVEDPWPVVFHEYGHQLLNCNTSGEKALWFDEGFAEYFSTIKINGKQAEVGLVSQERGLILQQSALIKVADLFRIGHNSAIYNETGDHRSLFYAQSWLVVHYLYDTNQLSKAGLLFDLESQNMPIEAAIAKAFGMEATQFDKTLRDYLTRNSFKYYTLPIAPGLQSASYTAGPLSDSEARAILADVHAHSPDYRERAMQEFEAVLKDDPENTTAIRGLGFAYLNNREFDKARDYFRRAAARNAQDPRVHYYWALLMNEEQAASGRFTDTAEMKKSLRAALALDSNFADAYSLLAYAQMADGETDDALKSMLKALELSPRNESYRFNLAEMYATAQKFDEAEKLLSELRSASDPMLAARAGQELIRVQNFKLNAQAGVQLSVREENQVRVMEGSGQAKAPPDQIEVLDRRPESSTPPPAAASPVKFLKGRLVRVDCAPAPGAVLEVQAGGRTYKFRTSNVAHAIVIGADKFSCAWTNQRVAVNYRETAEAEGNLVSIEIQ